MTETNANTTITRNVEENAVIIERFFDAPRDLVWKTFTEPAHLVNWWAPHGWTLPVCEIDFRPGGTWVSAMRGAEGDDHWGKAVYREIVAPERLVYLDSFTDAEGNPIEGMPTMLITLEFIEQGDRTKIISHTQFATAAEFAAVMEMGGVEGVVEIWNRLAEYLTTLN